MCVLTPDGTQFHIWQWGRAKRDLLLDVGQFQGRFSAEMSVFCRDRDWDSKKLSRLIGFRKKYRSTISVVSFEIQEKLVLDFSGS
jgi:hypothetical protein